MAGRRGERYPAFLVGLARDLYAQGLSCREVSAALEARGFDPAPCPGWVRLHLERLGALRPRGAAVRASLERRNGRPYAGAMVQARDLEARGWPRKTIARRLGIDERTVRFWLGPSRIGQSEAARRSYVLRIGPSRYREQVARVLELRTAGGTYEGIAAELGISWHRVRRHCLEADLGGRRGAQRARKSALRAPQSAPGSDA